MAGRIDAGARWRIALWGGAALLLLAPAVAMQFTEEMNWGAFDFAIFAAMLAAVCIGYEVVMRTIRRPALRIAAGLGLVAAFLLVWAELAVGIFH